MKCGCWKGWRVRLEILAHELQVVDTVHLLTHYAALVRGNGEAVIKKPQIARGHLRQIAVEHIEVDGRVVDEVIQVHAGGGDHSPTGSSSKSQDPRIVYC